jgi:hypothetical protein
LSQHDLTIDNASGLTVRTDLNLALKALGSNQAGTVDPSASTGSGGVGVSFAYQFWIDTSGASPVLKIRNAANSAWVTLGYVDTTNFGFRPPFVQTSDPTTSASTYQFWFDTTNNLLKMRNGAGSAWITVGDITATNLGLMPKTGGTFTGQVTWSNTDYIQIPVGTTAQRPGSPAVGMIRYNSDLTTYESYKAGAWSPLGAGGGGGSLQWIEGDNAPVPSVDSLGNRLYAFTLALGQTLYAAIKVPHSYTAGSPIKLYCPWYSPDSSGNVQFQTVTTLIRPGTSTVSSTTNQRTSTNAAVTLGAGTVNVPQMVTFDLSSSTGQINAVSIAADDMIYIALTRNASDTGTSDAQLMPYIAELTFS